jgi:hypothetical protein
VRKENEVKLTGALQEAHGIDPFAPRARDTHQRVLGANEISPARRSRRLKRK